MAPTPLPRQVSYPEALRVWIKVALLSFGGPAGQIAVMHRILVEEKRWIGEDRFLHALNYCMLLPGPEAQQLATYIGWLLHGWRGGVTAGVLFVLPGFLSILALSIVYAVYQQTDFVGALFFGLKAATLAVVVEAVLRIGKKALKNTTMRLLAVLAFVALFFLEVPFPIVVLAALTIGLVGGHFRPDRFCVVRGHETGRGEEGDQTGIVLGDGDAARAKPGLFRAVRVAIVCLSLWFVPLLLLSAWLGHHHLLVAEGVFFSKAATVTFGGAYSVLAYVAQQAVEVYGWLQPGEMLDGLGMAETTPGPLIQVVQFVGFMGAYRDPAPLGPIAAGVVASIVVTWVTFVPCFGWIFLGAPHVERLRGNQVLSAGLSAITAAVVGVIANLAVWFAVHVAFSRVLEWRGSLVRVLIPELASANLAAITIAIGAFLALFKMKWNMIATLAVSAAVGIAWSFSVGR